MDADRIATAKLLSVTCRELFRLSGDRDALQACVGMYVRVKLADGYQWGRITEVVTCGSKYPFLQRQLDVRIRCDIYPAADITLAHISSQPPTLDEIVKHETMMAQCLPSQMEGERMRKDFETATAAAAAQAEAAAKVAPQLGVNALTADIELERKVASREKAIVVRTDASPHASVPDLPRTPSTDMLNATQTLLDVGGGAAEDITRELTTDVEVYLSACKKFDNLVEHTDDDLERLATLTHRNRVENRKTMLKADGFEKKLNRKGNLLEEQQLWEVDDKRRAELVAEYDREKEKEKQKGDKKEDRKKGDDKSKQKEAKKFDKLAFCQTRRAEQEIDAASSISLEIFELAKRSMSQIVEGDSVANREDVTPPPDVAQGGEQANASRKRPREEDGRDGVGRGGDPQTN